MVKKLRSLLHEKITSDIRVQIELISRRRDLLGREKFEEVIKLLQDNNIEGIVPLGPGTNRFAFKLDGFVIKVATDNEGKADNLKEFKMAKRLYPYVIKVYEVSENGGLLVCEYIQPFMSYAEMCQYSSEIKDILKELSSVYLIGDVGINPQNYGNWGLRIGGNTPVCLDFAYIYSVSSDLFKCIDPKCNGIMVPDENFFELYCNCCKKRYSFQDIRSRLANDQNSLEIGDLTKEGYRLTDSGVSVDLDPERSNYLRKSIKHDIQTKKEEDDHEIPFIMDHDPKYYYMEENTMSINRIQAICKEMIKNGVVTIPATARISSKPSSPADPDEVVDLLGNFSAEPETVEDSSETPVVAEETAEEIITEEADEAPVFTAKIKAEAHIKEEAPADSVVEVESLQFCEENDDAGEEIIIEESPTEESPVEEAVKEEKPEETPVEEPKEEEQSVPSTIKAAAGSNKRGYFRDNYLEKTISRISYKIGNWAHEVELFDQVRGDVPNKKIFPGDFYKAVNSAIFNSLTKYLGFTTKIVPNDSGIGTHKEFIPPEYVPKEQEDTLIFLERFWHERRLNHDLPESQIMTEYKKMFSDRQGLQPGFIDDFKNILIKKIKISIPGAAVVAYEIKNHWCSSEESAVSTIVSDDSHTTENVDDISDDYDEDKNNYISVYVYNDDDLDVIRVNSGDVYGKISIPIYAKIDKINPNEEHHSMVDDRNGIWDWLIHRLPDVRFRTKNPEKWLEFNSIPQDESGMTRIIILDKNDNGEYIMGLYYMEGIFKVDNDGMPSIINDSNTLARLNLVITECTGLNYISHLERSLTERELIRDEQYVEDMIMEEDENNNDELEAAAIDAVLGSMIQNSNVDDLVFSPIHKK